MSNCFTAQGVDRSVGMTNGATNVFCDVVALAGSSVAGTAWQRQLVVHFCDLDRVGIGMAGFDLADLPWTRQWPAEKEFFLHVIDRAAGRHGWERLRYEPNVDAYLSAYRGMLVDFVPRPTAESPLGDWTVDPEESQVDLCRRHEVFRGWHGCRLCDVSLRPVNATVI